MRIAAALLVLAGLTAGQDTIQPFAGTWEVRHEQNAYVVLAITVGEKPSGTIRTANIAADSDGIVTAVETDLGDPMPLHDLRVAAGKLQFHALESDGGKLEYEMSLDGERHARLRIAGAPLRPFALTRH